MIKKVLTREFWDPRIGMSKLTWKKVTYIVAFSAFWAIMIGLVVNKYFGMDVFYHYKGG